MTVPGHRKPCPSCSGMGVVPRAQRRLPNGDLDPFDTGAYWPDVTCETCTGSGSLPDQPRPDEKSRDADLSAMAAAAFC